MADENNDFKYYTGISFPMRLNNQGQIVMSTVNTFSAEHLNESIEQILHTSFGERVMEDSMYSDINSSLFQPNDISLQSYLSSKIVEALELDERIVVDESGIEFYAEDGYLFVTINYSTTLNDSEYETTVKLGEVRGGSSDE